MKLVSVSACWSAAMTLAEQRRLLRLPAPGDAPGGGRAGGPGGDDADPAVPPQPDLFVGRTGVMARASAALAPRSKVPGVLLHGMPGGGKTAYALELAYTHEHAFEVLVWFKAPDVGLDIGSGPKFAQEPEIWARSQNSPEKPIP